MLNFRQRRKLGVTFRSIRGLLNAMPLEDKTDRDPAELAGEILNQLVDRDPTGWRDSKIDWGNIDWDALLSFIEKIITLIIKLFL